MHTIFSYYCKEENFREAYKECRGNGYIGYNRYKMRYKILNRNKKQAQLYEQKYKFDLKWMEQAQTWAYHKKLSHNNGNWIANKN